jgi:phosphoadenosine phosphosulfate reductase
MKIDLDSLNSKHQASEPQQIIEEARDLFGTGLVMTSSFGAESIILIHLVNTILPGIPVIFVDTGYLPPETHLHAQELEERFNLNIHKVRSHISPEEMEKQYGELWKKDMKHYNFMRKVEPMKRALRKIGANAVFSGIRREQTENRRQMSIFEKHDGEPYRIHPVLNWTDTKVTWHRILNRLSYHALVVRGFHSIGDTHSTVPGKGREGRLLGEHRECGLHLRPQPHLNGS